MFVNNFLTPILVWLSPNLVSHTLCHRWLKFGSLRSRSVGMVCALLSPSSWTCSHQPSSVQLSEQMPSYNRSPCFNLVSYPTLQSAEQRAFLHAERAHNVSANRAASCLMWVHSYTGRCLVWASISFAGHVTWALAGHSFVTNVSSPVWPCQLSDATVSKNDTA